MEIPREYELHFTGVASIPKETSVTILVDRAPKPSDRPSEGPSEAYQIDDDMNGITYTSEVLPVESKAKAAIVTEPSLLVYVSATVKQVTVYGGKNETILKVVFKLGAVQESELKKLGNLWKGA